MRVVPVALFVLSIIFANSALGQTAPEYSSPNDIPVEVFGSLAKNSSVKISPDGKHFAILSFIDGTRYLVITPFGEPAKEVIPPYDDMRIVSIDWANNETIIIKMQGEKEAGAAFGKVTISRLISYNINEGKPKNMAKPTKVKGSKERTYLSDVANVIDILPSDPDKILVEIDEDGTDQSLEVRMVDVDSGNYTLEMDFYGDIQDWMTDPQGDLRLAEGIRRVGTSQGQDEFVMFYRNPVTDTWVEYTDSEAGKYTIAGFFKDPRYAYAFGRDENGYRVLYKYDMVDQKEVETLVAVDGYDLQFLLFDRGSRKPIGVYFETSKPYYYYFEEEFAAIKAQIDSALPDNINYFESWTNDHRYFVVQSYSDVDPGGYYLFDNNEKSLSFIEPKYEGLDSNLLSPMKARKITARDGVKIPVYLTLPKDKEAKNLPTVILPHGGPQTRDVWGYVQGTNFIASFLASRGYAVLQPNFRGSTGYGSDFAKMGRQEWGLKMQDDLTDSALWMVEKGYADPDKICILGWSYGGYAALAATIQTPDLFSCSISINGISDLLMLLYDDSNFLGLQAWGTHIGDPGEDKTKLKDTSAYFNTDKIRTPILLIATRDDTRVNYRQSKKLADKLEGEGKAVKYVEIKEGGHSALDGDGLTVILQEIEHFLDRYIGGR